MKNAREGKSVYFGGEGHEIKQYLDQHPHDAGALGRWAYALWKNGHAREGLEAMEKALELDPDDPEVLTHCASIFTESGRQDDAREILEAFLERNPNEKQVQACLHALMDRQKGISTMCQKNDEDESMAAMLVSVGEDEFINGQAHRSRICFEIAIEKNPHNAQAYNNLGVLYWNEGDLEKALEYLSMALDRAPTDGEIMLNCARALGSAGESETASQLLELYLSKHPDDAQAWSEYREMVRLSEKMWRPDGLSFKVAEVYLKMGNELAQQGDLQGAAEAYARSLRIHPENVEGCYRLGVLSMEMGHFQEALELLEQARLLDGESSQVQEALETARRKLEGHTAF
ncbi:tetratricopeptide repeat protein [Desulfosoma sp.]